MRHFTAYSLILSASLITQSANLKVESGKVYRTAIAGKRHLGETFSVFNDFSSQVFQENCI